MTALTNPNMNGHSMPVDNGDSLVKIVSFDGDGDLQLVHGYDADGFRISGTRHNGPVVILPRLTQPWTPPRAPLDVDAGMILPLLGDAPPPLLIFGAGAAPQDPLIGLVAACRSRAINLEVMSTAAACRTWNVLMSEGRNAAACLYLQS